MGGKGDICNIFNNKDNFLKGGGRVVVNFLLSPEKSLGSSLFPKGLTGGADGAGRGIGKSFQKEENLIIYY